MDIATNPSNFERVFNAGQVNQINILRNTYQVYICHDLKRILRVPDFCVIFIKHGFYYSGSGAQVLIVIYFKLH